MNNKGNVASIVKDLKEENFIISEHAFERMGERGFVYKDILFLIKSESLNHPQWNKTHKSWNFTGKNMDNEEFTIACHYEEGTLIASIFWK